MLFFLFFFFKKKKKPIHLRGECRHQFRVFGKFKRGVDVAHEDWFGVREGTHLLGEHPFTLKHRSSIAGDGRTDRKLAGTIYFSLSRVWVFRRTDYLIATGLEQLNPRRQQDLKNYIRGGGRT
ncbi:hypothetical protein Hanom_Chr07g00616491 [Helianthus anomalus]